VRGAYAPIKLRYLVIVACFDCTYVSYINLIKVIHPQTVNCAYEIVFL
jgi:hypothetical protein